MCFHFCFCFFSQNSYRNCKFVLELNICITTPGIRKYKSIINKKRKKHDKIVLAKSKLNSMEVLISKTLNDLNITHDEFLLINNVLKEFYDTKEKIKNFDNK